MSQHPITLSGNLTDDPKCINFDTGSTLTRLRIASSRRVRTENTDTEGNHIWTDVDTLYIDVECWGQLAVNVGACLRKGMPVLINGRLVSDKWTDEQGKPRYKHIIKANQVALELSRYQVSTRCTSVSQNTPDGMKDVEEKTRDHLVQQHGMVSTRGTSADGSRADVPPATQQPDNGVHERHTTIDELGQEDQAGSRPHGRASTPPSPDAASVEHNRGSASHEEDHAA